MTIDLDGLERLAKAATPSPWRWDRSESSVGTMYHETPETLRSVISGAVHCEALIGDDDAAFIAAANPAVVIELIAQLRAATAQVALASTNLIHDDAFMAKLVDEHEKKYGDAANVIARAIVRDLAKHADECYPDTTGSCGCHYTLDELARRAVEATR